ncbi:TetR/AcrR family transcriptional regulator [Alsobacter sp. SYSU BS001988]
MAADKGRFGRMARARSAQPASAERSADAASPLPGAPAPRRTRAPRKSATERREEILEAALAFFAEHGFSGSTHVLAAHLGVRQALLYRYFESKDALVEAVFQRVVRSRWTQDFPAILADRAQPLEDRLATVYRAYSDPEEGLALRVLMRAALDGFALPARRGPSLTEQIFAPLVEELRHEAGLPPLSRSPLTADERSMAMLLHGAVVFQGVREHIYRTPEPDRDAAIDLHVATFLAGARRMIRTLHPGQAPERPAATRPARAPRAPKTALERLAARRSAESA